MHPPLAQPARTLRGHCAVSQAWPDGVADLTRPCRRRPLPCRYTQARAGAPCHRSCAACHVAQGAMSRRAPCRAGRHVARPLHRIVALPTSYRGASPGRVAPISRYNLAAKPRACHDTPIRIAIQSPSS